MRKLLLTGILVLLFHSSAFSHGHWIDLENFYPAQGEKTVIFICSGHSFPASSFALGERLLSDTGITHPSRSQRRILDTAPLNDMEEYTYTTKGGKKRRAGEFVFETKGTHLVRFSLKKPPLKEPIYCAKSIVLVGNQSEDNISYALASQIEVVPEKNIFTLTKGERLPLRLLYDGKPVRSTFSISIEGKKNFFLQTNKDGLALLKITRQGRYLITSHYKGKGCSLTFRIREFKKD